MRTKYVWIANWIDRFHASFRRTSLYTKDHNIGDGAAAVSSCDGTAIVPRNFAVRNRLLEKYYRLCSGLTYYDFRGSPLFISRIETFDRASAMAMPVACEFIEERKARACRRMERFRISYHIVVSHLLLRTRETRRNTKRRRRKFRRL